MQFKIINYLLVTENQFFAHNLIFKKKFKLKKYPFIRKLFHMLE